STAARTSRSTSKISRSPQLTTSACGSRRTRSVRADYAARVNEHHLRLAFNAPLSSERAASLVTRLSGETLLDLGCGWGELVHRWLDAHATARAKGVDTDEAAIARARSKNHPRATFVCGDAASNDEHADVIVCVGASHAFGGTAAALGALRGRCRVLL